MPQLIFKACSSEVVQKLSETLPPKLSQIADTPEDYFTFEWQASRYFSQGIETPLYPLVEIQQFRRPDPVQKSVAECIAQALHTEGYPSCEVYFLPLQTGDYYEFS